MIFFIYGSLKRGECNSPLMESCQFVREVWTEPEYRLFDCGHFPGLVESENGISIFGELWEVPESELAKLDAFEGVSSYFYKRDLVHIKQCPENVFAYFWLREADRVSNNNVWTDGHLMYINCSLIQELWETKPNIICPCVDFDGNKCYCKVVNSATVCDTGSLQLWCLTENFENCIFYKEREEKYGFPST